MLNNHTTLSDKELKNRFAACNLDPKIFNHEAHLRLTWIYLRSYAVETAIEKIRFQLFRYVHVLGASEKYNETLTIAAIKAVHHFMLKSKSNNFRDFISEFPRLKSHFKELMQAHYSVDIFNSPEAKTTYLQPDVLPFD